MDYHGDMANYMNAKARALLGAGARYTRVPKAGDGSGAVLERGLDAPRRSVLRSRVAKPVLLTFGAGGDRSAPSDVALDASPAPPRRS